MSTERMLTLFYRMTKDSEKKLNETYANIAGWGAGNLAFRGQGLK